MPDYHFPADLAEQVTRIWDSFLDGVVFSRPPLPSPAKLRTLMEVAYLAGLEKEEGRPLCFMICCTMRSEVIHRHGHERIVEMWPFSACRPYNVQELRRLAVTCDIDTAAIWVEFSPDPDEPLVIRGLLNLGSSWVRARRAFSYSHDALPEALLVRVDAPGQLTVFQGSYVVATLRSGRIQIESPLSTGDLLGAYPLFREGQKLLRSQITPPRYEVLRDWDQFEWLTYVNTILAIVNGIQCSGHGGALILAASACELVSRERELVKVKYQLSSDPAHLRRRYVEFMNIRHQYGDMVRQYANDHAATPQGQFSLGSLVDAQRRLAETCAFIGNLAAADGALLLRTDLTVVGFGTEILLDRIRQAPVYELSNPFRGQRSPFDAEQHGTRHRSAMRLCATLPDLCVFVVSQDGGVSLIWSDNGEVYIKTGIQTTGVFLGYSLLVPLIG
ncbi:MAG: hypothetical protein DIU80_011720 [Chloroflexota bacterium]|nr:MAG: hypothetical protein DIU80_01780 [Chloroflexota bacterium]